MSFFNFFIAILSLTAVITEIESQNVISNKFRITRNATIEITNETNQSLIETIDSSNYKTCLLKCNQNRNCDLFVLEKDHSKCRFYKKTFLLCLKPANESNQIVYDKFVKWLWFCCNRDSNYIYQPNMNSSNCFYLNPALKYTWANAYQYCLGLNQGFTLAVLNRIDTIQFAKNLSQTYNYFWVNLHTNTARVFYWPDGSAVTIWLSTQPDNAGYPSSVLAEDCAFMTPLNGLNDASCSQIQMFLCYIPN